VSAIVAVVFFAVLGICLWVVVNGGVWK